MILPTLAALGVGASSFAFAYSFLAWVALGTRPLRPIITLAAFALCCAAIALTL